jgi:hypothetical protein
LPLAGLEGRDNRTCRVVAVREVDVSCASAGRNDSDSRLALFQRSGVAVRHDTGMTLPGWHHDETLDLKFLEEAEQIAVSQLKDWDSFKCPM